MKRGKKYTEVNKKTPTTSLSVSEAMKQIHALSTAKFKGKIEVHVALTLNDKEKKQPVRGSVTYAKPVGKAKRVLVFADPKGQDVAKDSGADYFGLDDLISKIKDGWIDFDVAIATPSVMPKIAALGRTLGTKGLMPNPKTGTVTDDIKAAVESYKGGKIDYKTDETGVIHSIIGTQESTTEELKENLVKMIQSIIQNSGKSQALLFKSIYIAPTMGPSIKIDSESVLKEI